MELVKNIFFNTDKIVENTEVKLTYAGSLFQNGSENVNVHYGFGENWDNAQDIKMEKTELGFQATIPIVSANKLNVCFNNSNGEWDNNYGSNYGFDIDTPEVDKYTTGVENAVTGSNIYGSTPCGTTTGNPIYSTITGVSSAYGTTNSSYTTGTVVGNTVSTSTTTTGTTDVTGTNPTAWPAEGNTNETNNTNSSSKTPVAVYNTPSWGELFKKTFSNIANYFSKLFGKNATNTSNNK